MGDEVNGLYRNIKENLGISVSTGDYDYCIMDPIERKYDSRLEVQAEANSSEWRLSNKAFQKIVNLWASPEIDCFIS